MLKPLHSVTDARPAALDTDFQGQKGLKISCSHRGDLVAGKHREKWKASELDQEVCNNFQNLEH